MAMTPPTEPTSEELIEWGKTYEAICDPMDECRGCARTRRIRLLAQRLESARVAMSQVKNALSPGLERDRLVEELSKMTSVAKQVRLNIEIVVEAESGRDPNEWANCVELSLAGILEDYFGDECFFEVSATGKMLPEEKREDFE